MVHGVYLPLYDSWKILYFGRKYKKKNHIQFVECFIIINNLRDTSVFVNGHEFLLEG